MAGRIDVLLFCVIITLLYNGVIKRKREVISVPINTTRQEILEVGKQEFMKYGYEGASLRRIAKEASVTTGAIYGYFPSKAYFLLKTFMVPFYVIETGR